MTDNISNSLKTDNNTRDITPGGLKSGLVVAPAGGKTAKGKTGGDITMTLRPMRKKSRVKKIGCYE